MKSIRILLLATVIAVSGCATGGADPEPPAPEPDAGAAADEPQDPQGAPDGAAADAAGGQDGQQANQQDGQPGDQPAYPPAIEAGARVADILVEPDPIEMIQGDTLDLRSLPLSAVDEQGEPVEGARMMVSMQGVGMVTSEGQLIALSEGTGDLVLMVMAPPEDGTGAPEPRMFPTPVVVRGPPVVRVEVERPEHTVYTGTRVSLAARPLTESGAERGTVDVEWRSLDPDVAEVTGSGFVHGVSPGSATIVASAEGVEGTLDVQVRENPVRSVELTASTGPVATGDVVDLQAVARDESGNVVDDVAMTYSVAGTRPRSPTGASVFQDGAFVASKPGDYRVLASAGTSSAEALISAEARDVVQEIVGVGEGIVSHLPSSDLWVFQGQDGRDYAYVGTHAGGQKMFAWDVTDPAAPVVTDSVVVDARVVNDVKVNDDASIAVITREGASNRQNGIVLLDISDPAHPTVLSEYTETVTGGVHNVFLVDDLVYAVHDGTNDVHIIDISDPLVPAEVGRWGIDRPVKSLHDVWVVDGLAYVSYWDDGVYILDVGDGRWGGTATDPAVVSSYEYTDLPGEWGNTHVAFPYTNSDGNTYLFVGDEVFGCETCEARSGPDLSGPRGYVHIFDMSDPENLEEVARYEVPEAGVHNLWIEDDKLYAAYYQAGLRVVDVSGELRGNLYEQGREVAWFPTASPDGNTPNQAMSWGPQPYGDQVFVSDLNSGLWVVRLEPRERDPLP